MSEADTSNGVQSDTCNSEAEKITLLLAIFEWEDTPEMRFQALYMLRKARSEDVPSWDSFRLVK